jgi:hypothetical protein
MLPKNKRLEDTIKLFLEGPFRTSKSYRGRHDPIILIKHYTIKPPTHHCKPHYAEKNARKYLWTSTLRKHNAITLMKSMHALISDDRHSL